MTKQLTEARKQINDLYKENTLLKGQIAVLKERQVNNFSMSSPKIQIAPVKQRQEKEFLIRSDKNDILSPVVNKKSQAEMVTTP